MYLLISLVCISFLPIIKAASGDFNYHRPGDWYIHSEDCGVGQLYEKQSPINVVTMETKYKQLPRLSFNYLQSFEKFNVTYSADGGGFELVNPGAFTASGSVLPDTFTLQQFHFHTPSEHTKDASHAVMEIHLVHTNNAITQNVVSDRNGLFVFGIMFELGAANNFLADLILKLENKHFENTIIEHTENEPTPDITAENATIHDVNVVNIEFPHWAGLFPADSTTRFYTYEGSLTTPPCYESVAWHLAATKQTLSIEQFIAINRLHTSSTNNRPIQPTNARSVYRSFHFEASAGFRESSYSFFIIYFLCFVSKLLM